MARAPVEGIHDPYLAIIDINTPEHLKLCNKKIGGLPESDRYDLTRSKWTDFYRELEDSVFIFLFKAEFMIVTDRDLNQTPIELKNVI